MANFVFIKNGHIRPAPGTRIIKAAEYAAIGPAVKVYTDAREKADKILKEARIVYQSEKEKGYKEGLRQAKQEMAQQMTALTLRTEKYYRDMEKQIVHMVMEIVKKVLQGVEPQTLVVAQVKNALSTFKGCKHLTIKANPTVSTMIKERFVDIMQDCPGIDAIDVKAVSHLESNVLIMESETGIVEASMDAQLEAIEKAIKEELQLAN
jgi:type III secretion protein L